MKPDSHSIRIDEYNRFVLPEKWVWLRGNNLWVCLEGSGTIVAPDGEYLIEPRSCFVFDENSEYEGFSGKDDRPTIAGIHYSYVDERGRITEPVKRPFYRVLDDLLFYMNVLQRILNALQRIPPDKPDADSWMEVLMLEIDRQDRLQLHTEVKNTQAGLIDIICTEIYENPGKDYPLDELAERFGCSRDHFGRLFKKVKHTSPRDFIVNMRIQAAENLLRQTTFSIAHIAESLGYSDIYFFSRQFKNKTGISPSAFRSAAGKPGAYRAKYISRM